VLVVGDAMRRDVADLYGGEAHTPILRSFADTGVVFERAYTQAPWTKPSIATLFTGFYPSQHRVATHNEGRPGTGRLREARETDVLNSSFATLAEAYKEAGFATAAFVSNPWLDKGYGFSQGFDVYRDSFARWDAPGSLVSLAAADWIEGLDPVQPFVLYLHYLEPHRPYGPLERGETLEKADALNADDRPLNEEAVRAIHGNSDFADGASALDSRVRPTLALLELAYAKGVENFDRALGEFVSGYARVRDRHATAWVVTSDHGDSLFAHGIGNHGTTLFEDEVAIPLIMSLPGVEAQGVRSDCPLGLVDLMPFLCNYSGLSCPGDLAGRDVLTEGAQAPTRYLISEGVRGSGRHRTLIGERYKLVYAPDWPGLRNRPYRFFDLVEDPGEEQDWVEIQPNALVGHEAFERMRRELPAAVAPYTAPTPELRELDPEIVERLEALGYLD
jgi:arylsulfatase